MSSLKLQNGNPTLTISADAIIQWPALSRGAWGDCSVLLNGARLYRSARRRS